MIKSITASLAGLVSASAFATAASAPAATASAPVLISAAEAGFFASAFAFFGGLLLTWPALVALVILGILFEHNEARGWAIFTALVVAVAAFFFFNVSLLTLAIGAAAYIVIGLVWSFWRYKRHVAKMIEEYKDMSANYKETALRALHPKAMLGTITAWIMIWPFSMVENLVGDIINFVQALVTKFFRGVYMRIYNSAVEALK